MRGTLAVPLLLLATTPAAAQTTLAPTQPECEAGTCTVKLTPRQLLLHAETLVRAGRYDDAAPEIDALQKVPETRFQARFLAGYSASEQGHFAAAAEIFKGMLADDPKQVRVRLELARAMLALGQTASADRQFKIAEQTDLPPDVARTIRGVRDVIRSKRAWRFDVDFGFAPDSNINNATGNDSITVLLGGTALPIELDKNARAQSGTGETGTISAGVRLPVSHGTSLLLDLDAAGTNYSGKRYDDYYVQLAAGPEFRLSPTASASIEAVGAERWYGGRLASRQVGAKLGGQFALGTVTRLGLQLDVRNTDALFDSDYSGWQGGLYANGERAVTPTLVASAGLFARRDELHAEAYSNTELGGTLGFGGELPLGINFGVSGSASRAVYDAPVPLFSIDPRKDWRLSARVTLGNRKLRVLGFSPQVGVSFARTSSTIAYYTTDRARLRFSLARYF